MPSRPTRFAEVRFGRVRRLQNTWGYLRQSDGKDAFAHRSSILEGSLEVGDVVRFVAKSDAPHERATFMLVLPSNDPIAMVVAAMDAQRVRPMKALKLASWFPKNEGDDGDR